MKDSEKLEKSRTRVIEAISQNMSLYGITPSIGRLYGLLFFSDKPLTLDEMKEELGMSKTSMSLAVRTLLDLNMVEKAWVKGVRKDLYVVKNDSIQLIFNFLTTKLRTTIELNASSIKKTIVELQELIENPKTSKEIREHSEVDLTKLENLLEQYNWLSRLSDSFETKEILNFIPTEEK